jgi:hypothetical protein
MATEFCYANPRWVMKKVMKATLSIGIVVSLAAAAKSSSDEDRLVD